MKIVLYLVVGVGIATFLDGLVMTWLACDLTSDAMGLCKMGAGVAAAGIGVQLLDALSETTDGSDADDS